MNRESRRKFLQKAGCASAVVFGGTVSAAAKDGYGESDPGWSKVVSKLLQEGKTEKAIKILENKGAGYGHTGTISEHSYRTSDHQLMDEYSLPFGQGPYSKDNLHQKEEVVQQLEEQVSTQDYWDNARSQVTLTAWHQGQETVNGKTYESFRVQNSVHCGVDPNSSFEDEEPADVGAISYEGSWWMARNTDPGIYPAGSVKSTDVRNDGVQVKYNEPYRAQAENGFSAWFDEKLLMHPNAEGGGQIFGHYSHTWSNSPGSTIDEITIAKGLLGLKLTLAHNWVEDTPGLLVTKNCDGCRQESDL